MSGSRGADLRHPDDVRVKEFVIWFGGGCSIGYVALLTLTGMVTFQTDSYLRLASENVYNFEQLLRINDCVDIYT